MKKLALAITLCFAATPVLACPHEEKASEEVQTADKAKAKEKEQQEAKKAEKAKQDAEKAKAAEKAKKDDKKPADKVSAK